MDIKIYSTPTCPHCLLAKRFLQEKNLNYTEYNVAEDEEKAQEMIKLTGQMGVPVIRIDKETESNAPTVIVGFDESAIEDAVK